MTGTQATIRLVGAEIRVEPFIRLTGSTHILCCTYEDQAPILAIDDGTVSLSVSVPDARNLFPNRIAMWLDEPEQVDTVMPQPACSNVRPMLLPGSRISGDGSAWVSGGSAGTRARDCGDDDGPVWPHDGCQLVAGGPAEAGESAW